MIKLDWHLCKNVGWCDLYKIDLDHEYVKNTYGVYIVWKGTGVDNSRRVLIIGQGYIENEILELRANTDLASDNNTGIFMSWATMAEYHLNGVEVFLNETLKPKYQYSDLEDEHSKKAELPWGKDEDDVSFEQVEFG